MAILYASSFDAQFISSVGGGGATTALTDRKYFDNVAGTAPTISTTTFLHGTAAMKIDGTVSGNSNVQYTLNNLSTMAAGCWFQIGAGTPSANCRVLRFTPTNHELAFMSTGTIQLRPAGATGTDLFTPGAGVWYWISLACDTSANPHTLSARVYGPSGLLAATDAALTSATAATPQTGLTIGSVSGSGAGGVDYYVDSLVVSDASSLLAPRRVLLLRPTGNGTHSFTANDFQNQASTNLTTASDFSALVNKVPPATTTFAKQVVIRTTGYCELTFEDLPTTGISTPEYVQLVGAFHPVAAQTANTSQMRLNDNGTITAEALIDASVATDTLEYRKHGYQVAPSTSGAWTTNLVNGLKARYGFSDDVTPNPAIDAIYLETVAPVTFTNTVQKKAYAARGALRNDLSLTI